jgi:UDP-N-acetylglucosamine--N-acetylmuramyl-(pentapeptide) pyrophosphoryl-undecaprenol N-acetylglucosamine transferase
MNAESRLAVLVAGGTGGHLFPAQALGEELRSRGFRVHLMTDERVRDFGSNFPAEVIHHVPSASLSFSNPLRLPGQAFRLARGIWIARCKLKALRPAIVAGFGGYPSFPPLIAAATLGIPALLHEQNAVMGRANAALSRFATRIALSFPATAGLDKKASSRAEVTGNPVRAMVLEASRAPCPQFSKGSPINLLVFGGSQGAKFFSDFLPGVIAALPAHLRQRLHITQQCRAEDAQAVNAAYEKLGVHHNVAAFFDDLPHRIARSHLVVCRSGASTIAELGVIGRAAIMVPLPHAIDNDQLRNAESFQRAGAGWVQPQATLTVEGFAAFMTRLLSEETEIAAAGRAALTQGKPDAAKTLADLAQAVMIS